VSVRLRSCTARHRAAKERARGWSTSGTAEGGTGRAVCPGDLTDARQESPPWPGEAEGRGAPRGRQRGRSRNTHLLDRAQWKSQLDSPPSSHSHSRQAYARPGSRRPSRRGPPPATGSGRMRQHERDGCADSGPRPGEYSSPGVPASHRLCAGATSLLPDGLHDDADLCRTRSLVCRGPVLHAHAVVLLD
jgi:hypothetical protein